MVFLKKLPLEVYVLIVPSILIIVTLFLSGNIPSYYIDMSSGLLGSPAGIKITSAIALIYIIKAILYIRNIAQKYSKDDNRRYQQINLLFQEILSALFIILSIFLAIYALTVSAVYLFKVPTISKIVSTSIATMAADLKLFGSYPPFLVQSLNHVHSLEIAIIWCYSNLFTLLPIFMILAMFNKVIFRKFVISFFVAYAIAWPIWYMAPVIHPSLMYNKNVFSITIPQDIKTIMLSHPTSTYSQKYIDKFDKFWFQPADKRLGISSDPSMHVAWGFLLVCYSIDLIPYIGFFVVPWFILNTVGTIFTLQHYGIDIIGGLIVGCLTLYITKKLMDLEKIYFRDDYRLLSIFDLIKKVFS